MPHSVTSDKIVGFWTVPYAGVVRDVSIYEVPSDGLWDSANMVPRDGQLVTRPGPQQYAPNDLLARPTAGLWSPVVYGPAFQPDAFQMDAFQTQLVEALMIVATQQGLFYLDPATLQWVNVMPTAGDVFQGDAFQADMVQGSAKKKLSTHYIGRFAQIQAGTPPTIYTVFVNGVDDAVLWDMALPEASQTRFSIPPRWTDVIAVADRFVGITPPYDVSWTEDVSSPAGLFSTPALNHKSLGETPDPVVAISPSGFLAFTVYKKNRIWTAVATGLPGGSAFRFSDRGAYAGPASPAAVVQVNGLDVRMTRTGRVGLWNGQQNLYPFDAAWRSVQSGTTLLAALDQQYASRIFGVYHEDFNEVWFHYPMVGDGGLLHGLFIVTLPDVTDPNARIGGFPGRLGIPVSAGCDRAATDSLTHLFRDTAGQNIAMLVELSDRDLNLPIEYAWQQGLTPAPGSEAYRLDGHETFIERHVGFGSLAVQVMSSYHLDAPDGTPGTFATLNLETRPLPKEEKGGDVRGRFFGLKYSGNTAIGTPKWMGARLAARLVELAPPPVRR